MKRVINENWLEALVARRKPIQIEKSPITKEANRHIDQIIASIEKVSRTLLRRGSCDTEAEHIELLEVVYNLGRTLDTDSDGVIIATLAQRVDMGVFASPFAMLIKAALPEVPAPMVKIWVGALSYASEAQIRPEKLAAFLYIKDGLVECGKTNPTKRRKEIDRWRGTQNRRSREKQSRRVHQI